MPVCIHSDRIYIATAVTYLHGLLGDDESQVVKYAAKMEKIYDAARRMKLNQARNERRGMIDDEPTERVD